MRTIPYSWGLSYRWHRSVTVTHPQCFHTHTHPQYIRPDYGTRCFCGTLLTCATGWHTQSRTHTHTDTHRCAVAAAASTTTRTSWWISSYVRRLHYRCVVRFPCTRTRTIHIHGHRSQEESTHRKKKKYEIRENKLVNILPTRQQYRPTIIQSYVNHLPERMRPSRRKCMKYIIFLSFRPRPALLYNFGQND